MRYKGEVLDGIKKLNEGTQNLLSDIQSAKQSLDFIARLFKDGKLKEAKFGLKNLMISIDFIKKAVGGK